MLRFVEAVNLVDEQARALAVVLQPPAGRIEHIAELLHARGSSGELDEPALRFGGDDLGERRLADAGRAVQDHRAKAIGLDQAPQERARAHDVALADVVGQPPRPHAGGQGRGTGDVGGAGCGEKVGHRTVVKRDGASCISSAQWPRT